MEWGGGGEGNRIILFRFIYVPTIKIVRVLFFKINIWSERTRVIGVYYNNIILL